MAEVQSESKSGEHSWEAETPPRPAAWRWWHERFRGRARLVALVLALITVALYARVLANGFSYDDAEQILTNPLVKNPGLWPQIFTGSVWSFLGVKLGANFYRPLQILSYWLLYRLAGPNPAAFHLFQLLLYAATVWLVYRVGCELLQEEFLAFCGALLWAVHPLHVEAVVWSAALPEVGFGFFYLLAFLLFLRAEKAAGDSGLRHTLAALVLLPALFFKEMALSFPLLLVAYWFFFPARGAWLGRVARLAPYLVAVGTYAVVRKIVLAQLTYTPEPWKISPELVGASLGLLGGHTRLFFWPVNPAPFRVFELGPSLLSPWPWLTLLGLALALWGRRREPTLGFLFFWWGVTLLPVLDVRQLSFPFLADRFSFIPSVGLCLGISFLLLAMLPGLLRRARLILYLLPALALLATFWAVVTARAIPHWRDTATLLDYSLKQSPQAAILHAARALDLLYLSADLDAAVQEYQLALRLNESSFRPLPRVTFECYLGLGQIANRRGQMEVAQAYFEKAIQAAPGRSPGYDALGALYVSRGDYAKAGEFFAEAVNANPLDLSARFYLGTCWMKLGRFREAAEQFRAARLVDSTYREAYLAEARALEAGGETAAAARVRSLAPNP